jgi:hypothetical protein
LFCVSSGREPKIRRDSFCSTIAPERIKDIAVRYTLVGGKVIYEAGKN